MDELVNSGKHNSTVMTTCDKYRLYVHVPLIRKKLGGHTEQFLEQLQNTTSKEAVKQLKRVYTMLDGSRRNCLPLPEPNSLKDLMDLMKLCGTYEPPDPKQGIIILSEEQLLLLDESSSGDEFKERSDLLTISGGSSSLTTSLTLASIRSKYF